MWKAVDFQLIAWHITQQMQLFIAKTLNPKKF
jgi:hypothetical protein